MQDVNMRKSQVTIFVTLYVNLILFKTKIFLKAVALILSNLASNKERQKY